MGLRIALIVVALGAVISLIGVAPMLGALVVSNQLIDDGPDPGDHEKMVEWDRWAFTPRNAMIALAGGLLMAVGAIVAIRRRPWLRSPIGPIGWKPA